MYFFKEYLPTGVRQILHVYWCLYGDISGISQLVPDQFTKHQHFIVSNFRKTFHLFLEYGKLPALPILQIIFKMLISVIYKNIVTIWSLPVYSLIHVPRLLLPAPRHAVAVVWHRGWPGIPRSNAPGYGNIFQFNSFIYFIKAIRA